MIYPLLLTDYQIDWSWESLQRTEGDGSDGGLEVIVERILPGGLGLAHANGRTVMIALAAQGDHLRVKVDRLKGSVAFASIEEIIEPSGVRVEPPCPYFGRCGGCDFQQLNYEAQLEAKLEIIKDCLRRIGGLATLPDFRIIPAPNPWHYRSRAQWQYDAIRTRLGYFESNSRRVCDVVECAVLVPELQQTLENLRERMSDGSLPGAVRDFRAVVGDKGVSLAPSVRSPTVREGYSATTTREESKEFVRSVHGESYHLNAETFFQTNYDLLPPLINYAMKDAAGDLAIDLYCGVGLFTIPLARSFECVIGVESDPVAARFARANLANPGLINAKVENQDVGDWLQDNWHIQSVEFLLLDPPRTGAESRVIAGILKLKPKRICYVSCDPATLARDLKKLIAGGYVFHTLAAFDMFPQTHHVETVVQLTKASATYLQG